MCCTHVCACLLAVAWTAAAVAQDAAPPASLVSPPRAVVKVLASIPHSHDAFTEGFTFWKGHLYESSGEYGESFLHEIDPQSGKELRRVTLDKKYFGEGLASYNGKLYQLTWREQRGFIYDIASLRKIGEFKYDGEGWGLASAGNQFIMTDGSEWIRFRNPDTFAVTRSIRVMYLGKPLTNLNELEYIDGIIWVNVWGTDFILRIDPADGHIIEILDASKVLPKAQRSGDRDDVLNGIAYDDKTQAIYITGKRWPLMFRIQAP